MAATSGSSGSSSSDDIVNVKQVEINALLMLCSLLNDTLSFDENVTEISSVLKSSNVDVNFCYANNKQNTLLHMIAAYGNLKVVGKKPLHSPVAMQKFGTNIISIVRLLMRHKDVDVNIQNIAGDTPLHLAVMQEKMPVVKELIKHINVNVNIQNIAGDTPLHLAVMQEKMPVVKELIKHINVNVNIKNIVGDTPLHLAVMQEDISVVKELINAKADKSIKNSEGITPLDLAINNKEIMKLLEPDNLTSESTLIGEEHSAQSQHSAYHVPEASEERVKKGLQDPVATPKNWPKADTHAPSGARKSNHGILYQLRVIMLFLLRAIGKRYEFELGSEVDEAQQFDDLVFKYVKPGSTSEKKNLFLQAKHVDNTDKKNCEKRLKLNDLFSNAKPKKAPFSLLKYYNSYLKLRKTHGEKANEIEFAICTNMHFNFHPAFQLTGRNIDERLTFEEANSELCEDFFKEGKCYKLVTDKGTLDLFCRKYQSYKYKSNDELSKNVPKEPTDRNEDQAAKLNSKMSQVVANIKKAEETENRDDSAESVADQSMKNDSDLRGNFETFLNNLIFVVDLEMPENNAQIESEFRDYADTKRLDIDLLLESFRIQMFDWFMKKKGNYETNDSVIKMIESIVGKSDNYSVYGISKAYTENLLKCPIDFNCDSLSQLSKLIDKTGIVHIISSMEIKLTSIQVAQTLKKSHTYKEEDSYIFIHLSSLLGESTRKRVVKAFESTINNDLLVIDCLCKTKSMSQPELRSLKEDLLKITDANEKKKILVLAPEEHPLTALLKSSPIYHCEKVTTGFQDFSEKSQNDLLAAQVKFQGQHVELSKVIEAKTDLLDTVTLEAFISDGGLVIGTDLPTSCGYNKSFYIHRNVIIPKQIKPNSFHESQYELDNQVAKRQPDFKLECFGPTKEVVQIKNEKDFINLVKLERVVVISDSAGTGKSTVLTHISQQIKKENPGTLVYIVDLNTKTKELQEQRSKDFDQPSAFNFLCDKLIVPTTIYERALLLKKSEVVLIFDGFDEISQKCKDIVIGLIEKIKESTNAQIWFTTGRFMREELENNLSEVSFSLDTFSQKDQVDFLMKYWKHRNDIQDDEKLNLFASTLVEELSNINDIERKCCGIPLQLKLLADYLNEDLVNYLGTDLTSPKLVDLVDLYEKFINKKFAIILRSREQLTSYTKEHQWYASCLILSEQKADLLLPAEGEEKTLTPILKIIGIMDIVDGKPLFFHRTFAEYLVAVLIKDLMNQWTSEKIYELMLFELFNCNAYKAVRTFLNGLLAKSRPELMEVALKEFGKRMSHSYKTKKEVMKHIFLQTAEESSHRIFHFLCDCLQDHPKLLMKLLLCADANTKKTMLHVAAENNDHTLLIMLLEKTLEHPNLDQEKVKQLLEAIYLDRKTALHVAARLGHTEFIQSLLKWPLEHLDDGHAIVMNMLKAADDDDRTALLLAAKEGHGHLILMLLQWSKDNLIDDRDVFLEWFLLTHDSLERTVLHLAAEEGHYHMIQQIMQWTIDNMEQGHTITKHLILATDNQSQSVLHLLAKQRNEIALHTFYEWTVKNLNEGPEIMNSLFQQRDDKGALAIAADEGHEHVKRYLSN